MFFAPIPEKGISDFIAHGSIIQVFTVFGLRLLPYAGVRDGLYLSGRSEVGEKRKRNRGVVARCETT